MMGKLAKRLVRVVDVHAVGAGIEQDIPALAIFNSRVVGGDVALRVGQNPVVVRSSPDRAAMHSKNLAGTIA